MKKKPGKSEDSSAEDKKFPLPVYSAEEDIYSKGKEISLEEDENKTAKAKIGSDLDVPGSELDDGDELIGEEDEENNYYSLGGDDHPDLDESNEDVLDGNA
jgi:hypothetical protein